MEKLIRISLFFAISGLSSAEWLDMFPIMDDGREVLRQFTKYVNETLPPRDTLWNSVLGSGINSINLTDIYSAISYLDAYNYPVQNGLSLSIPEQDKMFNETLENLPGQALERIYQAVIPHLSKKYHSEVEVLANQTGQRINCKKYRNITDLYQYSYIHLIIEEWQTMDVVIWMTRCILYFDNTFLAITKQPYEALEKLKLAIQAYKRRVKQYLDEAQNLKQIGIPEYYKKCDFSLFLGEAVRKLKRVQIMVEENWVKIGVGINMYIPKFRAPWE